MSAQANILALSLVGLVGLALASEYKPEPTASAPPALPPLPPVLPPRASEDHAAYADQLVATSRMQAATLSPGGREALAQTLEQAAGGIRSRSPYAASQLDAEAARLRGGTSPTSTGQEQPPEPQPQPQPPPPPPPITNPAVIAELQRRAQDYLAGRSMGLEDAAGLLAALVDAVRSVGVTSPLLPDLARLVRFVQNPELSPLYASPL